MGRREDARDAEFTAYLHARQPSLLRTAYLLTGDRHQAEDILQTSLAKLYLSWDTVRDRDSVDAYVRRIMVNENSSLWRRCRSRSSPVRASAATPAPTRT
jgi:DNA-directed RNA polymerase specialized sigma24 family protein